MNKQGVYMKIIRMYYDILHYLIGCEPCKKWIILFKFVGQNLASKVFRFQNLPHFIIQHLLQLWMVIFRSVVG